MGEDVKAVGEYLPMRSGTQFIDDLGAGPWRLMCGRFGNDDIVIAISPDQPARCYRDGKRFELFP